jgi:nitrate reductase delta subunit
MFESSGKDPDHLQALERVKAWTRERFALSPEAAILVAELACPVPGCPPIETVVVFWTVAETRYRFKLFKPVKDVACDDLPYAWLRDSLLDDGGLVAECC